VKNIFCLFLLLTMLSCTRKPKHDVKKIPLQKPASASTADTGKEKVFRYTDQQLESYLDSVGQLSTKPLADKVAFGADSVFKDQTALDSVISLKDLTILKHAIHKGVIAVKTARRIFGNNHISYDCTEKSILLTYKKGLIPVVYYSFDKDTNEFNEYAICVGDPGHCVEAALYFFKGNRLIALHDGYNRNAPDLEHYKDADGKTVVYYGKEFDNGSGIWWFNFFFYKYDGNKVIPVLDELQNGNRQNFFWGPRVMWLESTVVKTNPLTIKMVYYQYLTEATPYYHASDRDSDAKIIDDSTFVQYTWNEQTKTLQGQYQNSRINKPQILSYYLQDNELLFMNAYYKTLKLALLDKKKRKAVLNYLNEIKNHYNGKNK